MNQSSNRKSLIISIIVAALIIGVGLITYLALKQDSSDQGSSTSTDNDSRSVSSSIQESEVLATIPTSQSNISFELMAPQRTGDTLVFNYNLVNTSEDQGYNVSDYRTGIYTLRSGEESPLANKVQEAYLTASDGQRYGLVSDDSGQQLVTDRIDSPVQPGAKIGGYFTFSLPPSGSTISLYPGNIQAINGIKIDY